MMKLKIIFCFMSFLCISVGFAQQKSITGRVSSEQSPAGLPGASIRVQNSSLETKTDENGHFKISAAPGQILVFSYVGLVTREVPVGDSNVINIRLESDNKLDEVVVVGYGTQKRSDLTGAVATIKGDKLSGQAVRSPVQALSGQATGVEVLQNSGQPGGGISVRVRGGNSLIGGNEPLYVIDGFPMTGDISNLNPNDIQSIDVLKDASATAIYGSRGANGVILVTTKKGVAGPTKIEYNAYVGVQNVAKKIDLLNAKEYATLANLRAKNDGVTAYFTDAEIAGFGVGTNWQNEIFRSAVIHNNSISIMGGTEKTKMNISGNYLNQDGVIINSNFNQLQLRGNIDHKINDLWKISLDNVISRANTRLLNSDNTERGSGVLSGALISAPTIPVRNPDGSYGNVRQYAFAPDIAQNPVEMALVPTNTTISSGLLTNMALEGKLMPGLVFRSTIGVQYNITKNNIYFPTTLNRYGTGQASTKYIETYSLVNENTLTYTKTINEDHNITLLGGVTAQSNNDGDLLAQATGFNTNVLENNSLQSGTNPGIPTSTLQKYNILSGLSRVNYSYKGKYLFTASLRADGSSRFGTSNKWGYFPSAALAWKVSEEPFWSGIKNVVNDFKVRGSIGQTGSTAVSPYQSLIILNSYTTVFDNNLATGFAPNSIKANPNLKWETTTQIDGGFDVSFLQSRLNLVVDYYYKKTNDLLTSVPLSQSTGFSTQIQNVGSIANRGLEVGLNAKILKGDVNWDLGANISFNRNKVLKLAAGDDIFGATLGLPISVPVNIVREGYPVGSFYGFVEDGIDAAGNIKYQDLDNNGIINNLDRKIIGNPNPDFIVGLNSSVSYKNFDLSFVLNAVKGNDIFNYNLSNLADGFSFGINQIRDVLGNYWTKENPNPNAKYPRIGSNVTYRVSSRFIEDGSYIRLRNIQLGYTLGGERFEKSKLKNSQIYISAQNLFTITNYSFYSPEVSTKAADLLKGGDLSKGVDQYGYPDARTFMLGLRLKF